MDTLIRCLILWVSAVFAYCPLYGALGTSGFTLQSYQTIGPSSTQIQFEGQHVYYCKKKKKKWTQMYNVHIFTDMPKILNLEHCWSEERCSGNGK